MRLRPELVPEPLWGLSANRLLPRKAWADIRQQALAAADNTCISCGAVRSERMICHEHWGYDETDNTATLSAFVVLCPDCNLVHHLGRARQLGYAASAEEHMAKVNNITPSEVKALVSEAFREWQRRSRQSWRIVVTPELLSAHPELAKLHGQVGQPSKGRERATQRKD